MKISGNRKSLFFHQFVFFMVAVLLLNMPVSSVYAAENNPEGNTISFPNINNQDDNYMDTNKGTISTLFATGTVKTNYGTIETSNGTVTENRGTIEKLLSGNVGTNYGTIDEINGTGTLGENDDLGTVTLNNGNTITRNDGKIVNNYGTVLSNYHEIVNNYGNVTMYIDSSVTNNDRQGVLTFKGNGTVESNTGTIVIEGANVTVNNNTGTIKLLDNATLICTNNYGSIIKENDIATYKCTCTNNYGTIGFSNNSDGSWSYVSQYYKIVFAGDDSKAELTLYEASNAGNRYTKKGSAVVFILPDEYVCNSGDNRGNCGIEGKSEWFVLTENVDEERKEFTIVCHLCSADSYSYDADKHWQSCSKCGRQLSESAHSFGDYVSNNDATCMVDGTMTRVCTICRYAETVADVDSHLKSDKHNPVKDPEVAATENRTGLTEGSHCADCQKVLVAQEIIPEKTHICVSDSGYLYDANGHWQSCSICGNRINDETHKFDEFVTGDDATCTIDGTKTHSCTVCTYKETVADVDSHLTSDKHNIVVDPRVEATEIRTGLTEGSHCADCGRVFAAQEIIPMKESSGTVVLDSSDSEPKDTEDTPISDDTKTDDEVPDDAVSDDAVPDDAVPDDAVSDDAVSDDEVSDDEVSDDAVSDDEVSDDEVPDDVVSDDEVSDDEVPDDEVSDDEVSDDEVPDDVVSDDAVSDDIVASDNTPAPNDKSDVFSETGDDASNTDEAANGKESEKKTTNVVPIVAVSSSVVVIGSLVTVWGLKRRKRFK